MRPTNGDRRAVAVIDPVSMGGPYGAEGKAMGLSMICVLTREHTNPRVVQSFEPQHYDEIVRHDSLPETVARLRALGVAAVVPGISPALELSDLLADALGLIGNPPGTLAARWDKGAMKERWTRQGVACAAFHTSGRLADVLAWAEQQGYPVVLKPPSSSAATNVFVCENAREAAAAFATITGRPDLYGRRFDTVVAEEYLDGAEFFVNLLHAGGPGELISAARYDKLRRAGRPSVYRNFASLPLDDPAVVAALPYVRAANQALEVRYGINDTEYKLTSRGPRAIEVNNRLPGGGTAEMIRACTGRSPFQDNIRIFLGERPAAGRYRFHRHYNVCCLINDTPGRVTGYRGLAEIEALPSYEGARIVARPGGHWPRTVDMATAWGLVRLVHEDREQLRRDAEIVHERAALVVS
ncbi:hypothetical protein [Nonomuraea sp. NPDC050783]|uniref:hypothetical protein n=1 Tax=Nonomuraea sp. NPDC050783 TaxID=3154634 RepID=UPI003464F011